LRGRGTGRLDVCAELVLMERLTSCRDGGAVVSKEEGVEYRHLVVMYVMVFWGLFRAEGVTKVEHVYVYVSGNHVLGGWDHT